MSSHTHSAPSATPVLYFGVEMEMLVRPKPDFKNLLRNAGWNDAIRSGDPAPGLAPTDPKRAAIEAPQRSQRAILRRVLAEKITKNGIPASGQSSNFTMTTLCDEPSLDEVAPDFWRLEIVTHTLSTQENWQAILNRIMNAVNNSCDVFLTTGCSMHVHVSPSLSEPEKRYNINDVRSILKAISYFDNAITQVMPPERKANLWAQSNMLGDRVPAKIQAAYRGVPAAGWRGLFNVFDRIRMIPMIFMEMGQDRYLSWNLSNLTNQCGTIEFRRPPGVRTGADAIHWAGFALGFIQGAIARSRHWPSYENQRAYPDAEELRRFINSGIASLGPYCQGTPSQHRFRPDPRPPRVYSAQEIMAINRKKEAKKSVESPFVKKANSRPSTPGSGRSSPSSRK